MQTVHEALPAVGGSNSGNVVKGGRCVQLGAVPALCQPSQ